MTKNYEKIQKLLEEAHTYEEIAKEVGLTKQRIQQIAKKLGIKPLTLRQEVKQQRYFDKWGHKDTSSDLYQVCRAKFRAKKANAKDQEWTVTFGELDWPTHCPVLGMELDYFAEQRQENSPSFDRIDSDKGYVTGNVKIISWRANRIKNDGTVEEHEKIIEYLRTRK
jgi:hypothetical protein